jgi:hypothetical protein
VGYSRLDKEKEFVEATKRLKEKNNEIENEIN